MRISTPSAVAAGSQPQQGLVVRAAFLQPDGVRVGLLQRHALLVGRVAGVGHHVQENPAQILGDCLDLADSGIQFLFDRQVEVGIARPGAVIGKLGVFGQQGVDIDRLAFARTPAHLEHALNDIVRPLAMLVDRLEVAGEVAGDLLDDFRGIVVRPAAVGDGRFPSFPGQVADFFQ